MSLRKVVDVFLTGVMVCCALLVATLAVRSQFGGALASSSAGPSKVPPSTFRKLASSPDVVGAASAPVKIVEFSDFQCPFCAQVRSRLDRIRRDSDGRVAVVYRHFPLDIHPHAFSAAVASRCAGEQGRFEQLHDELFESQDSIGKRSWVAMARSAGIADTAAFVACMNGPDARRSVQADLNTAQSLKLQGTPAILVGDTVLTGDPPAGVLENLVRREMRGARSR